MFVLKLGLWHIKLVGEEVVLDLNTKVNVAK